MRQKKNPFWKCFPSLTHTLTVPNSHRIYPNICMYTYLIYAEFYCMSMLFFYLFLFFIYFYSIYYSTIAYGSYFIDFPLQFIPKFFKFWFYKFYVICHIYFNCHKLRDKYYWTGLIAFAKKKCTLNSKML